MCCLLKIKALAYYTHVLYFVGLDGDCVENNVFNLLISGKLHL